MEVEDQTQGNQTGIYWFEIYAPDEEGVFTLGADIIFETPQGWTYTEGAFQTFDIDVEVDDSNGFEIPGMPIISIFIGLLFSFILVRRKSGFNNY